MHTIRQDIRYAIRTFLRRQPERLVTIRGLGKIAGGRALNLSRLDFRDLERANRTFETMGAFDAGIGAVTITGFGEAERVRGVTVSGNFFQTLRAAPELGRLIDLRDDATKRECRGSSLTASGNATSAATRQCLAGLCSSGASPLSLSESCVRISITRNLKFRAELRLLDSLIQHMTSTRHRCHFSRSAAARPFKLAGTDFTGSFNSV
jgi:hypothetical protein